MADGDAWLWIGRNCPAGTFGCPSSRDAVSEMAVERIAYEGELRDETRVLVNIACTIPGVESTPCSTVTWTLKRQEDETWRLFDVMLGGALVPPSHDCSANGYGE